MYSILPINETRAVKVHLAFIQVGLFFEGNINKNHKYLVIDDKGILMTTEYLPKIYENNLIISVFDKPEKVGQLVFNQEALKFKPTFIKI